MAAALRLQGGALLGAADAFGELTATAVAPMPVPSPAGTPTGAVVSSGGGAAGFGAAAVGGVPPAVGLSGPGSTGAGSDGGNPYHTQGSLAGVDTRAYTSTSSQGGGKRYSDGEAGPAGPATMDGKPGGGEPVPSARYPLAPAEPPSDNPYSSVRSYQYA